MYLTLDLEHCRAHTYLLTCASGQPGPAEHRTDKPYMYPHRPSLQETRRGALGSGGARAASRRDGGNTLTPDISNLIARCSRRRAAVR